MTGDKVFVDGITAQPPREGSPEWVISKLWIRNQEMIDFLQARIDAGEESTNAEVKQAKSGKFYVELDTWKPESRGGGGGGGSRGGAPTRERAVHVPAARPVDAQGFDTGFADDDIPFITWGAA